MIFGTDRRRDEGTLKEVLVKKKKERKQPEEIKVVLNKGENSSKRKTFRKISKILKSETETTSRQTGHSSSFSSASILLSIDSNH